MVDQHHVVTVIGARPQFIKAAMVSRELTRKCIRETIVHTGQHFDYKMSKKFFSDLSIPEPKFNLNINQLTHGAMTGRMLERIEEILLDLKPDMVLVYGDTNSTLAGALAADKLNIPVAHVEAGLRSFNRKMPEETNRIIADRLSSLLFCPSEVSVSNLNSEGISEGVHIVGDVMFDSLQYFSNENKAGDKSDDYILVTLHREENTDNKEVLNDIIKLLNNLAARYNIKFPIHPRTRKRLSEFEISANFDFMEPVGYLDMLELIKNASLVMTDSGGVQKEAFFLNKYCITLRDETEWIELINLGYNYLWQINDLDFLVDSKFGRIIKDAIPVYGDGTASVKIANLIDVFLN